MAYRDEPFLDEGLLEEEQRLIPNRFRLIAAFIVSPAIASVALALMMPGYFGLPYFEAVARSAFLYGVVGAYPTTLVLGVPIYLMLRHNVRAKVFNCALAGAFVAMLPWAVLGILSRPDAASTNGRPTVVGGEYTAYGWLELAHFLSFIAAAGAVGGLIFWLVAAVNTQRQQR